ncbi:hypothetical protein COK20_30940, partial [Bacillus cereus]
NNTMTQTTLADVEVGSGSVTLGKGSFSAVIDTEGSFSRGSQGISVRVNREGSLSLNLPN